MNILITLLVSAISVFAINNFVPLKYIDYNKPTQNLGATITTILGSDTLSSSRTTINNNFANLNSDKFETTGTTLANLTTANALTSASSLATVGTITSGTWQGTGIDVARQGTGTTSPTSNQIILGNGSSGFKVVSGFGDSGDSLVSNGASVAPTWQAVGVNQNDNYTWTGTHTFNGPVLGNVAINASTTVYTTTSTYIKPTGAKMVHVRIWGGGGSGGRNNTQDSNGVGGGGGGGYAEAWFQASSLASSESVTIGAGGTAITSVTSAGNIGGNTTFGTLLTAYGGGGGGTAAGTAIGGAGGCVFAAGASGSATAASPGTPFCSGGGSSATSTSAIYSSGGGGDAGGGGDVQNGGAGGGGADAGVGYGLGGNSILGGDGGKGGWDNPSSPCVVGTVPGGGGGGFDYNGVSQDAACAGGAGQAIITTYF